MKTNAMFRVVELRPDGGPVLVVRQSTLEGAELFKRLIQRSAPFSEFRIEYGPNCELGLVEGRTADRRIVLTERSHRTLSAIQEIQPDYDVVVDSGDGKQVTIESGLSREMADAAKAQAMELFQGVRIVDRTPGHSAVADATSESK
jgi:hypothetical protein